MKSKWLKYPVYTLIGIAVLILGLLITAVSLSRSDSFTQVAADTEGAWLLVNARLAGANEQPVNLFIQDGKIEQITSKADELPTGVRVVDVEGQYLMPALMDSHAHIFEPTALTRYLAHGVTTIRNMQGMPAHLRWREAQKQGQHTGSRMLTATPTFNGNSDSGPFHKVVTNPDEVDSLLKDYKQQGYDFVKVYEGLSKEVAERLLAVAEIEGLPVSGHIIHSMKVSEQIKGMRSIEHIEDIFQSVLGFKYDAELMQKVADALKAEGTMVTTTMVAFEHIHRYGMQREQAAETLPLETMNPMLLMMGEGGMQSWIEAEDNSWMERKYQGMEKILLDLTRNDIPLAVGSDTGPALTIPGYSLIEELMLLSKAGLDNQTIIEGVTLNNARLMGLAETHGQVREGFIADLILLESDPYEDLETLWEPKAVIQEGHYYGEQQLEKLNSVGQSHQSFFATAGVLLDHIWSL